MNRIKCIIAVYLTFFLVAISSLDAQGQSFKKVSINAAENENIKKTVERIDGSPMLLKIDNEVAKISQNDPEIFNKMKLEKRSSWGYTIGSAHTFWAVNSSGNFYQVPATCKKVGIHCYLFVENSSFNDPFTQANVDTLVNAFDNKTPANSKMGIYVSDTTNFGPIPNVDNDPKVIILVVDLSNRGGYFSNVNEYSQTVLDNAYPDKYKTNFAEMFYVDASQDVSYSESTLAHEFQHMIHFNYFGVKANSSDLTFINEGWSMVAEVLCGYDAMSRSYYEGATDQYFYHWASAIEDANPDYSRAAWFAYYLNEQVGKSVFKKYLQNTISGSTGISYALQEMGSTRTFKSILKDWFFANTVSNKTLFPVWGYNDATIKGITGNQYINPNLSLKDSINSLSTRYFTYTSGNTLNIKFNLNSNLNVASITYQGSGITVQDIPDPSNITISGVGTTISKVTFMVYHNDDVYISATPYKFSYVSTGTFDYKPIEIKYDATEPSGYLGLTPGDSVAVYFDGVPGGANLDSIRVALRSIVPINGVLKNYAGYQTELGGKTLANFTLTSKLTAAPSVPYPVPWTNWVTADLRSLKINPANSFVVELPIGATYPASNRVMVTEYQSTSSYHSFAYSSTASTPYWLYYSSSSDAGYIYLYLIRAYVSFTNTSGVKQTVELVPSTFKLNQNYPNPFNPSTVISYQLASISKVHIKVYDILGKEIATLVNEQKPAGNYQITWDGTDNFGNKVTSGVYFYRIDTDNFVQTKKMVLMK